VLSLQWKEKRTGEEKDEETQILLWAFEFLARSSFQPTHAATTKIKCCTLTINEERKKSKEGFSKWFLLIIAGSFVFVFFLPLLCRTRGDNKCEVWPPSS
jgi:hypothetical protein